MGPNRCYYSGPLNLGIEAINGFFTLRRFPELEPHHLMQFRKYIPRNTFGRFLRLCRGQYILSSTYRADDNEETSENEH